MRRAKQFKRLSQLAKTRTNLDNNRRRKWDAICLIADFQQTKQKLEQQPIELELIWHVREQMGGIFGNEELVQLNNEQLEWLIRTFRPLWPWTSHPREMTHGNANAWDASEFILRLVRRLGKKTDQDSSDTLLRLLNDPADEYTESIKVIAAEQTQLRVEATYSPPSMKAIKAITNDLIPESASDLQAAVLEELESVQAQIKSDDVDSWKLFYENNHPLEEEDCRDRLIGLLRERSQKISYEPESHGANDKRVDIACSAGQHLRIPIEIKGQWHRDVWHAADTQLDRLYNRDHRAENRGIYLVLWFGPQSLKNKKLQSPGRGFTPPQTPTQMQDMILARSTSAREGRTKIVVLDLTHFTPGG